MHFAEIRAWASVSGPSAVTAVNAEGQRAGEDWSERIHRRLELEDLPLSAGAVFWPRLAITAAANAAIELAIIVALWPERPGSR